MPSIKYIFNFTKNIFNIYIYIYRLQFTPFLSLKFMLDNYKDKINFIIYHKGCTDGFASVYCVWLYLMQHDKWESNQVKYIGCQNDDDVFPIEEISNKNVLLCDICPSRNQLEKMVEKSNSLIVIDHHVSNQEAIQYLPEENRIFDTNHSAAYLTWKFFHPEKQYVPQFILYIEDRDLWRNEIPETKYFTAFFNNNVRFNFKTYDYYAKNIRAVQEGVEKGKTLYDYEQKTIQQLASKCNYQLCKFPNHNNDNNNNNNNKEVYIVAYINSNVLKTDLGNYIVEEKIKQIPCDLVVVWNYNDYNDTTHLSLRSGNETINVSEIAKIYGGGGHTKAAGIRFDGLRYQIGENILDDNVNKEKNNHNNIGPFLESLYVHSEKLVLLNKKTYRISHIDHTEYEKKNELIKNLIQYEKCKHIDILIVRKYNEENNETVFVLLFFDHNIKNDIDDFIRIYQGKKKTENVIVIKKMGNQKKIEQNEKFDNSSKENNNINVDKNYGFYKRKIENDYPTNSENEKNYKIQKTENYNNKSSEIQKNKVFIIKKIK